MHTLSNGPHLVSPQLTKKSPGVKMRSQLSHTLFRLSVATLYVPEWIAIYSLRQEILENQDTGDHAVAFSMMSDYELAHQQQG